MIGSPTVVSESCKQGRMQRQNNFDILRLILAWMVVVVHCCSLSESPALGGILRNLNSSLAIEGFFAISGCLIVSSYDRSRSLREYGKRRAERILPAYYAATVLALVVGVSMTTLPLREFLLSKGTWKFLGANVILLNALHTDLPGVFQHNPAFANVNGALWTIKVEVGFYLFVPLFVLLCRKFGNAVTLICFFAGSVAYRFALARMGHWGTMHGNALERQLPGQLAFFMVGAAVYFYLPYFLRHPAWAWTIGITCYAASMMMGVFALRAIGLPMLIMCLGFLLPAYKGLTRFGDFSYGAYVYHFPIVQTFVALGLFRAAPYTSLLLVVAVVAVLSVFSWNYVEKIFLRRQRVLATALVPVPEASGSLAA